MMFGRSEFRTGSRTKLPPCHRRRPACPEYRDGHASGLDVPVAQCLSGTPTSDTYHPQEWPLARQPRTIGRFSLWTTSFWRSAPRILAWHKGCF